MPNSATFAAGNLELVSELPMVSQTAGGNSFAPRLSADGRYVVFSSHANNLVTNDDAGAYLDVFLHDRVTGVTTLISASGNGDSAWASISAGGQRLVFASDANNLTAGDTNLAREVFTWDLPSGPLRLLSANQSNNPSASILLYDNVPQSSRPVISASGRWVPFESTASDLVSGDTNELKDIFMRDLQEQVTTLVSAGTQSRGLSASHSPAISSDGGRVAFVSTASNLVNGVRNVLGDIYVRDVASAVTLWASTNVGGLFPASTNGYECEPPVISADGRFVAFKASEPSSNTVMVLRHDLDSGTTTVISSNSLSGTLPSLSHDGRFVAYEDRTNIYVWDALSRTAFLVTTDLSGSAPAAGRSRAPVLTPNGRHVVFASTATNLVADGLFDPGVGFQIFIRNLEAGVTRLVSRGSDDLVLPEDFQHVAPSVSDNGRIVAFDCRAKLSQGDLNAAYDVAVRDIPGERTEIISVAATNRLGRTGPHHSRASESTAALSSDGRWLAYTSFDSEVFSGDTNRYRDVFVKDLQSGAVLPGSINNSGQFAVDALAQLPALSAGGRYLFFCWQTNFSPLGGRFAGSNWLVRRDLASGVTESVHSGPSIFSFSSYSPRLPSVPQASEDGNLVAFGEYGSAGWQVYLRDMSAQSNHLISIHQDGSRPAGGISVNPILSPNRRWVAFESNGGSSLTTNASPVQHLYARDVLSNVTVLLSRNPDGTFMSGGTPTGAVFTASSRYVWFQRAWDYTRNYSVDSYRVDLENPSGASLSCTNCHHLGFSADDVWIVFQRGSRYQWSLPYHIWLKNATTGEETLISRNRTGSGPANGSSTTPAITPDGRFIVFASEASDLVAHDTNGAMDVFVHDRALGVTMLVSRGVQGKPGNRGSGAPVLAKRAPVVMFRSFASDLIEGDYNEHSDVFVLRLGAGDSDGDGLDDGWEVAYFDDLSRDGAADGDGDGAMDRHEFLSGTDPTARGSVLTVLSVSPPGSGSTMILWAAAPGRSYQVQFKSSIGDSAWTDLPGVVTASDVTATYVDTTATGGEQRYYRVAALQ